MEKFVELWQQEKRNLKKDFAFYNRNTELFAVWALFYTFFAAVFFYSLSHGMVDVVFIGAISFVVGLLLVVGAIVYVDAVEQKKNKRLAAFHRIFNKTIKISLPRLRFDLPKLTKFRLLYK